MKIYPRKTGAVPSPKITELAADGLIPSGYLAVIATAITSLVAALFSWVFTMQRRIAILETKMENLTEAIKENTEEVKKNRIAAEAQSDKLTAAVSDLKVDLATQSATMSMLKPHRP